MYLQSDQAIDETFSTQPVDWNDELKRKNRRRKEITYKHIH